DDTHGGVAGVIRASAGGTDPHDVTCFFVQGDEALRAVRHRAPGGGRGADDHQTAIDDRGDGASAVRGEGGEFFGDGVVPQFLAIFGERGDEVVGAENVNVAGFRIGRGRGPGHAVRGDIALIHVEFI